MFRAILKGSFSSAQVLAESSCLVAISLGGKEHTGKKFAATLELVAETFKEVTIMIADTLQVYTRAIEHPELSKEAILHQLRQERDLWLAENQTAIDKLGPKFKGILLWEECVAHPDFQEKLNLVNSEYHDNPIFTRAVDSGVGRFVSRFARRKPVGWKFSKDCPETVATVKYILEESAVLLLWPEKQYNFIVYPHKLNEAMYNLLQRYVHPDHPDLLQSLVVDFKPIEQMIALAHPSPTFSPPLSPLEPSPFFLDRKSPSPFFLHSVTVPENTMKSQKDENHLLSAQVSLILQQIELSLNMLNVTPSTRSSLLESLISNLQQARMQSTTKFGGFTQNDQHSIIFSDTTALYRNIV